MYGGVKKRKKEEGKGWGGDGDGCAPSFSSQIRPRLQTFILIEPIKIGVLTCRGGLPAG